MRGTPLVSSVGVRLPARYKPLEKLGQGGGGEVWAVEDRHTGRHYALKLLSADANEEETTALVKEAVALSGLEGLGVPKVIRFGKLPDSNRPYLVRELVVGRSLQELLNASVDPIAALTALAIVSDKLTRVHRAGLLHGDFKPANIIVSDAAATLVDLGLAAPFREAGIAPSGLTPKYAAPELLSGGPLTVRAETYAMGVTLGDILESINGSKSASSDAPESQLSAETLLMLKAVWARATDPNPHHRYPSADEFVAALRSATSLHSASMPPDASTVWPVVGIEATSARLLSSVFGLPEGGRLEVAGPHGSGRSVLLRRLAWSLGIEGRPMIWLDDSLTENPAAIELELQALNDDPKAIIIVDEYERLALESVERLDRAVAVGARLVVAVRRATASMGVTFDVPPLDEHAAAELARRAIPSLTSGVVAKLLDMSEQRPGAMKALIGRIASHAVASREDIEALSGDVTNRLGVGDPLAECSHLLDRGRLAQAAELLASFEHESGILPSIARARVAVGLGQFQRGEDELLRAETDAKQRAHSEPGRAWRLWMARSQIGLLHTERALSMLADLTSSTDALGVEAQTYQGLALYHQGKLDQATEILANAVSCARALGAWRVEGIALLCHGIVHLRAERMDHAQRAYEEALIAAERAGDANTLSTIHHNLAAVLKMRGDMAGTIRHLDAAIDAGRRAGQYRIVRRALANLANLDLYLGRLQRGKASIDDLEQQSAELGDFGRAQLAGLKAEYLERIGDTPAAIAAYCQCSLAFQAMHLKEDAAEASLVAVLLAPVDHCSDIDALERQVCAAKEHLGESPKYRPLLSMAEAHVARLKKDEKEARKHLEVALTAAREAGLREWVWRAFDMRADLEAADGHWMMAQRDTEAALIVLEEIATGLPQDLREVYWNDDRRYRLRSAMSVRQPMSTTAQTALSHRPLEKFSAIDTTHSLRLTRILEINSELLKEFDLERLNCRVIECALEILRAERGFVILEQSDGELTVHTSRSQEGDSVRTAFSRSIAQRVMMTRQPVVSRNASLDVSMRGYDSVHQMMLQGVACVPINGQRGDPIGALYLEAGARPDWALEHEMPTLKAFADQVGLAIQTARLVTENLKRSAELSAANVRLQEAQARLRGLLGERTEKLKVARRRLRDARDTLYGHFGYQGLVGTSAAMRRVYSLIERLKDTDIPVMITGETGTGKEMVARALHGSSERNKEPFLGINCGAIPEHLLESELFGHVKGAFTGADRERKGIIREAANGTLLLDEIGEIPYKMQAGLLRALQERTVRPIGGTAEQEIGCRFVFATHRDLKQLTLEGKFREDLYYRIVVVEIDIPPLREHVEDIPLLVDHFLGLFAARYKRERKTLSKAALRSLAGYAWPGNVRQLEHVLLNAWVLSDQPEIDVEDLEILGSRDQPRSIAPSANANGDSPREEQPLPVEPANGAAHTLASHLQDEKARIVEALAACNWNRVKAAELLDMPRRTFYRRLKQYELQ